MEKKEPKRVVRTCAYCDTNVENPDINYCPSCKNVVWDKRMLAKRWI
jgi:hypothetical protein